MSLTFLFVLSISIPTKRIKESSSTMFLIDNPKEGFWPSYKIDRSNWKVTANSEQTNTGSGEGPVTHIIDDNPSSIWHSKYNNNGAGGHDNRTSDSDPYQITIDLSQETTFRGFSYTPRQEGGVNGKFRHYEFYVAQTEEELTTKIQKKEYLSRGDIEYLSKKTTLIIYNTLITGRYIALLSVMHDGYGTCSEFNLYSDPPNLPERTPVPTPIPTTITLVDFEQEGYWASYRMDRQTWKVTTNNEHKKSGDGEGPVTHIIDGDISSIWHTKYGNGGTGGHDNRTSESDPYQIIIDFGKKMKFRAFSYTPRQSGINGKLNDFEIYEAISKEDLNVKIQNKEYVAKGDIDSSTYKTTLVVLDQPVSNRYFAFLSSPAYSTTDNKYFGTCAEFNIYSDPPATPAPTTTPTPKPTPMITLVDFENEGYWASYKIDSKDWILKANSEQTTTATSAEGPITNIIDGKIDTIWHSKYNDNGAGGHNDRTSDSDPFQITINLGHETTFRGFSYTPRQNGVNGRFQFYEFYIAQTEEELTAKIQKSDYLSKGSFNYNSPKTSLVIYNNPETAQFIAILSLDHDGYGSCAQFNLYSDPQATPMPTPTPIPPPTISLVEHRDEGFWASYRMDRTHWNIKANSEQTTVGPGEGPVTNIIDGNIETIWHSQHHEGATGGHDDRGSATDPFQITIDIGEESIVRGFSYTPRKDVGGNGKLHDFEFYTANSKEELDSKVQNKEFYSKGNIDQSTSKTTLVIHSLPIRCQFVAFLASPGINNYGTCAEFNLYSDPPATPLPTPTPRPTPNIMLVEYGNEGYWAKYRMERYEWHAKANSEQTNVGDGEGPISHIIDDESNSIWHSKYNDDGAGGHDDRNSPTDPFQITVDLGQEKVFNGFSYTPRQEGGENGKFRHYEFYVAQTEEELTDKIKKNDYLSKGDIDHTSSLTSLVIFDEPTRGQFVALLSIQHDSYGTCSEFNLYSVPPASPLPTSTPKATPIPTPMAYMVEYGNEDYWSDYKIKPEGWIVTANSEHTITETAEEGPVKNIIDGNTNTIWHTKYNEGGAGWHDDRPSTKDPFQITIDLGKETTFRAFSYTPRQTGTPNGRFRHYEFYLAHSSDELKKKIEIKDYLSKGDIDHNSPLSTLIVYYAPQTARFVSILSVNHDGYGTCAEFDLYSDPPATIPATPFPSPTEKVPDPTFIYPVDCNNKGRYEKIVNNETESIMLTIKVTEFKNIDHDKDGGAIYVENAGITCDGNKFNSCTSNSAGGAIYVKNTYDYLNLILFENLEITKCRANYGGGMYIYSDSPKNTVTIKKCTFTENTALIEDSSNNNELYGGSCIFLSARAGSLVRNKFYNNFGSASVRLYNDFDDNENQNQKLLESLIDNAFVLIKECVFEISKNEKCSIFYDRGNKGANYELNKCTFSGELHKDSSYIDGRVISEKSPLLVVNQCKFENDSKKLNKFNDKLMKVIGIEKKNQLDDKKKSIFGLMKIAVMVVAVSTGIVVGFVVFILKRSRNNDNQKSEMEQNIIDASIF